MTDISITRFLPTLARDKVNSVQAGRSEDEHHHAAHDHGFREDNGHEDNAGQGEEREGFADNKNRPGASERDHQSGNRQLEAAVACLNDYVQTVQRDIIFGIDSGTTEPSVTVVDRKSRKLVRQFGGKEALELARKVEAQEPLSLFKAQV
ncbi:MAG: flagellar protein FlaG [Pseudomonadota bacterium]